MTAENRKNQKRANPDSPRHSSARPDVPEEVLSKWQVIVDTIARIIGVPAGLIMKVDPPRIEVFVKSNTEGNPYKAGERYDLVPDLYCQWVMKHDSRLLIPNALKDPQWDHNPEIESGMISYLGFPLRWPDGEMFGTVCVVDTKENHYSDTYQYMMSQFRDIAESHLALLSTRHGLQDRLAESITKIQEAELLYKTVADFTYDWEYWQNPDGTFRYISPSCERVTGYKPEEFLDNPQILQKLILPEDKVRWDKHHQEALEKKGLREIQICIRTRDGQVRWIEHACLSVTGDKGEFLGFRASNRDITKRKQTEEALEERLQFRNLASGISTRFIGLSGIEFEQAIHDALTEIGRHFNSDTVRLYRLSLQGDVVKIRNMWRDEHLAPPKEMAEIHKMKFPNLAAHYSRGESTVFSKFDDSPQWPEMRKILKFFGTKAGVGVPLEIDSSGVDVFAMDKVQSEHVWPEDIIEQSKAIGEVILSAMRRREAEVKLQNSYDEIKELKDCLETENIYLQQEIQLEHRHGEIIGRSGAIQTVLNKAEQVAKTDSTVLVLGETGTGKELLARAIHNLSNRKARTMVKVNCAAMPSTLIESEFFGREKGAYTGALTRQAGRFEIADRSTIFLDEISELSLDLQAKLLRVLQEGQFERLGNPETIEVDVRVIAATNRDLAEAVQKGTFRDDLYYRLNVFPITIPPLRERREDIPTLVWHFVPELSERMGKRIESVPKKTMEALQSYPWPGNVRELRNVIENAMIVTTGSVLQVEIPQVAGSLNADNASLQEVERNHILAVLEMTGWRIRGKNGAAEILGLKPTTLEARMRKLDIQRK